MNIKHISTFLILGCCIYFSKEISFILDLNNSAISVIFLFAIWGVWKCQYFIWQKPGEDPLIDCDTGREYKSLNEFEYKESKYLNKEQSGREVKKEKWIDKDGTKYTIFRVIHELGEYIFIPYKKES